MSSNSSPAVSNKPKSPLSFMLRIADSVYLVQRDLSKPTVSNSSAPKLVVLFGWLAAQDGHLAKYVEGYQKTYPSAAVLLLKPQVSDMIFSGNARRKVQASIPTIRAITETEHREIQSNDCELLIHAFSNGGSRLLSALYEEYKIDAFKRRLSIDERILAKHVTIIDSAPTPYFDRQTVLASVLLSVPRGMSRAFLTPILHVFSFVFLLHLYIPGVADGMALWAASHNDKAKVHESRRAYIYSDSDPIIKRVWVEQHADAAEKEGFSVRRELFSGSPHVSHARTNPERYWAIIQETWTG